MSFEVDISQLLGMASALQVADDLIDAALITAGDQIALQGANSAKQILAANGSWVTGALGRSIQPLPTTGGGSSIIISYGPSSEYPAKWVEKGRRAIDLTGTNRVMSFRVKGKGRVILTQKVAAAPARPFMRPSVERIRPTATRILGNAVMRVIEGVV
jgi:hypothetical protein